MNILDKIIADKHKELVLKKLVVPISQLEQSALFERKTVSLAEKPELLLNIKDVLHQNR